MKEMIGEMHRRQIDLLISRHYLRTTPSPNDLRSDAHSAAAAGAAIFKLVTRTDTREQLARLITFFEASRDLLPIAAMGIGKLGLESRFRLDRLGSALTYASIGRANVAGQPSLSQLRRAQRAYIHRTMPADALKLLNFPPLSRSCRCPACCFSPTRCSLSTSLSRAFVRCSRGRWTITGCFVSP